MIKSVVVQNEKDPSYFPRLLTSNINGCIVLFSKENEGTLVSVGTGAQAEKQAIGTFKTNWNMGCFIECEKKVTLENL